MIARRFAIVARLAVPLVLLLSASGAAMAAAGAASMPAVAREAMEKGLAAARNQDYRGAIRLFEEARKADPLAPEPLFNLGLAESKIPGRELAAMVWLKAYLAAGPNAPQAQKVRDLYGRLEATVNGTIRKYIDLDREVAGKLREDNDKHLIFHWISLCQARIGDFAGALQSAPSAGRHRDGLYLQIALRQAEGGDLGAALKTAELAGKSRGRTYLVIAGQQAKTGNLEGAIETLGLARRFEGLDGSDYGLIMTAFAECGDVGGVMKIAELAGMRAPAYRIAQAQARKGDVAGAMKTASVLENFDRDSICFEIVKTQVGRGDIAGALQTAKRTGDRKDGAYMEIAYGQALKGDRLGSKRTFALISNKSSTDILTRRMEIAEALRRGDASGDLRKRVNVLLMYDGIIDELNSPEFPWLTDLPAYLRSLNALSEPRKIAESVHNVLLGIPKQNILRGGAVHILEQVRDLDRKDD